MLNNKEIIIVLKKLFTAFKDDTIHPIFFDIERSLFLETVDRLNTKAWNKEQKELSIAIIETYITEFKKSYKKNASQDMFVKKFKSNYSRLHNLHSFLTILIEETPENNWRQHFKRNPEHACFLLTVFPNIDTVLKINFDYLFKDFLKSKKNDHLRLKPMQINPLLIKSFYTKNGFKWLKRVSSEDLLDIVKNLKKEDYNKAEYSKRFINHILVNTLTERGLMKNQKIEFCFVPKDKNNNYIEQNFIITNEGDINGSYYFYINQKVSDFQLEDLEQLKKFKYLVNIISQNSNLEVFFVEMNALNNIEMRLTKEEYNSSQVKKELFSKITELENSKNVFEYFNIKRKENKELKKQINYYNEIKKTTSPKIKEPINLKYKFNFIGMLLNYDLEIVQLYKMMEFISDYPEYYDEEKKALYPEGSEIYLLNNLF